VESNEVREVLGMKRFLVAMLSAALLCALGACDADTAKGEGKPRAQKQTQKPLRHEKLFADTKTYLAKQAARTAEVIRTNAANLKKTLSADPQPPAKAKTQPKKALDKAKG
jgi:hypothetical protein